MLRVILTSFIVYIFSQLMSDEQTGLFPNRMHYILYNVLVVFCFYSFFNAIIWNYELNFLITITFFYILSIAMYYIHEFRGTNLSFSDIASISTAKEVAGGYKYRIRPLFIFTFFVITFLYVLHIRIYHIDLFKNYHKVINGIDSINIDIYRFFWHEIGHLLAFFISFFILRDKISDSKYDYSLCAGENEGYIYNFFSSIPIFHKSQYNYEETLKAASNFIVSIFRRADSDSIKSACKVISNQSLKYKSYAFDNADTPHIIVIMNESFGTIHRRIKTDLAITPFYDNFTGVTKGNLYVNTFGGGTANTEFEFLTGMTIGNYPYPVMPYNNFVKKDKYSIAKLFNNLGYRTIAMHPYTATNYHRNNVYKRFGFQELYFFDDFYYKEYVRKFISDEAMYKDIIRRFRVNKANKNKVFMFGITMQNHSGYENYTGVKVMSTIENLKNRDALDTYLTLVKISDNAISKLINYFEQEEEHVIVLFFGDHNASFGTEINKTIYDTDMNYSFSNAYATPFFIYDNKFKEDKFIKNISANFLSVELLKHANIPIDMMHEMLGEVYTDYSCYNFHKRLARYTNEIRDIRIDKYMMLEKEYLK